MASSAPCAAPKRVVFSCASQPTVFMCDCGNILGDNSSFVCANARARTITLHSARNVLLTPYSYDTDADLPITQLSAPHSALTSPNSAAKAAAVSSSASASASTPTATATATSSAASSASKCQDVVCCVCQTVIGRVYTEIGQIGSGIGPGLGNGVGVEAVASSSSTDLLWQYTFSLDRVVCYFLHTHGDLCSPKAMMQQSAIVGHNSQSHSGTALTENNSDGF